MEGFKRKIILSSDMHFLQLISCAELISFPTFHFLMTVAVHIFPIDEVHIGGNTMVSFYTTHDAPQRRPETRIESAQFPPSFQTHESKYQEG